MKLPFPYLFVLYSISLLLILSGCMNDDISTSEQNHLPQIESITAKQSSLLINTETTITCVVSDDNNGNLIITWSAKRGVFTNGVVGSSVTWIAPSTAGKDTITVWVGDGRRVTKGVIEILVGTVPPKTTLFYFDNYQTYKYLNLPLYWNQVDSPFSILSYTLQVSANSSFTSFVYNQSGLTKTSQQISGLTKLTTYYWRVKSTNVYGESDWSDVSSFNTVGDFPKAPILLSPENNSVNQPMILTFSWNPSATAINYHFEISPDSLFRTNVAGHTGFTNTFYEVNINIDEPWNVLKGHTTFYWRLKAYNIYGGSEEWSEVWRFTTKKSFTGN